MFCQNKGNYSRHFEEVLSQNFVLFSFRPNNIFEKLALGRSFYKMGFMALKCPILSRCYFINRRTDNVSYRTLLECELNWSTGEYPHQCTPPPRQQFARRTKICIMAANICGAPVCNFISLFWRL